MTRVGSYRELRVYPASFVAKPIDAEAEASETRVHLEFAEACGYVARAASPLVRLLLERPTGLADEAGVDHRKGRTVREPPSPAGTRPSPGSIDSRRDPNPAASPDPHVRRPPPGPRPGPRR